MNDIGAKKISNSSDTRLNEYAKVENVRKPKILPENAKYIRKNSLKN